LNLSSWLKLWGLVTTWMASLMNRNFEWGHLRLSLSRHKKTRSTCSTLRSAVKRYQIGKNTPRPNKQAAQDSTRDNTGRLTEPVPVLPYLSWRWRPQSNPKCWNNLNIRRTQALKAEITPLLRVSFLFCCCVMFHSISVTGACSAFSTADIKKLGHKRSSSLYVSQEIHEIRIILTKCNIRKHRPAGLILVV
jgi:hypothetical protein